MSTILVIDSDPVQRASLGQVLAPLGEVEVAGTGLDALRLLATKKFSVAVLDLHVRPLDGFVILRTLSTKGGPNKETPVYALAADAVERDRALREHAVFALIKPVSLVTVKNLIEADLNRPPGDEGPPTPPVSSRTTPPSTPGRARVSAPSEKPTA
jgi:CheY-like chemotaxis protein